MRAPRHLGVLLSALTSVVGFIACAARTADRLPSHGPRPPPVDAPARPAEAISSQALFHTLRGHLALEAGQGDAAQQEFALALTFDPHSAQLWTWRAQAAFMSQQPTVALEHVEHALVMDPTLADALRLHADLLWHLNRPQDAEPSLTRLVAQEPAAQPYAARLMGLWVQRNLVVQAQRVQAALVRALPHDPDARLVLARVCQQENQPACALSQAQAAWSAVPQHLPACLLVAQLSPSADALALHDRCVTLAPLDPAALLPAWRARRAAQGDAALAAQVHAWAAPRTLPPELVDTLAADLLAAHAPHSLDALLGRSPEGPQRLVWLARGQALQGQCNRALDLLRGVPFWPWAGAVELDCLLRLGQPSRALARWQQQVAQQAAPPAVLEAGCRTLVAAGQADAAVQLGQRALAQDAESLVTGLRCLVWAGHLGDALAHVQTRLDKEPDHRSWVWAQGLVHLEAGQPALAVPVFRLLVAQDPKDAEATNVLAYTLLNLGGHDAEAWELAQRAAVLLPSAPEITDTLGLAALRAGHVEQGLALLTRAAQALPFDPEVLLHLGEAQWAASNPKAARLTWERAIQLLPADLSVRQALEQRRRAP